MAGVTSRALVMEVLIWTLVMTATVVMSDEVPGSGYVEVPCCTHHFRHQKGELLLIKWC